MVSHLTLAQGIKLNTNCGVHNITDGILHLWELSRLFPDPLAKRKTGFSFPIVCVSQMGSFSSYPSLHKWDVIWEKGIQFATSDLPCNSWSWGCRNAELCSRDAIFYSGRITATISRVNQLGLDATVGARGMLMLMLNLLYTRLILPTDFFLMCSVC